ncbi:L domain-like protein [Dioscorea alata]|uniref:L domain-like protein n=1 Tax=Dioscorea alata TaxID=55571 RepID=A0ACB7U0X5_DIOAL|nr:L domain-like protein [Dioscorea alata]
MQVPQKIGNGLWNVQDYKESLLLILKGREDAYNRKLLSLLKVIDFSGNHLSGDIPEELTSLYGLQALNLSGNYLEGEIPNKLGRLQQLETLDLSRNELTGSIPWSFSNLSFLSHLNVSYNHLTGRVPSGNQMNTFTDPSIYIGNDLCGFPLGVECGKDGERNREGPSEEEVDEEDDDVMLWWYIGSTSGFAVGFWSVWGVLVFKKSWRYAWFYYTDKVCNMIIVAVVLSFARIKKKMMMLMMFRGREG